MPASAGKAKAGAFAPSDNGKRAAGWRCFLAAGFSAAGLAAAGSFSVAAPFAALAQRKPPVKVRYNEVVRSVLYVPAYIAISKGFFAEQGIEPLGGFLQVPERGVRLASHESPLSEVEEGRHQVEHEGDDAGIVADHAPLQLGDPRVCGDPRDQLYARCSRAIDEGAN